MKNDRIYIVFNNDNPEFYSFDEEEANSFAKKKQAIVKSKNDEYGLNGISQLDRSYWHVHDVPALPFTQKESDDEIPYGKFNALIKHRFTLMNTDIGFYPVFPDWGTKKDRRLWGDLVRRVECFGEIKRYGCDTTKLLELDGIDIDAFNNSVEKPINIMSLPDGCKEDFEISGYEKPVDLNGQYIKEIE